MIKKVFIKWYFEPMFIWDLSKIQISNSVHGNNDSKKNVFKDQIENSFKSFWYEEI